MPDKNFFAKPEIFMSKLKKTWYNLSKGGEDFVGDIEEGL